MAADGFLKQKRGEQADLVNRIVAGDEAALEEFYDKYFSHLYRYVYYRVGRDHHHTEEVIHDTFMEALEKAKSFDPARGSVESWLITMSRNRIRSVNALMNRPREYEKSWNALDGELESVFADPDQKNLPESMLENEELKELVGITMGSLSVDYAKLLELKYITNLSVRDIAHQIHKTEKAVESQLTRARVAFREAFKAVAVDMPGLLRSFSYE